MVVNASPGLAWSSKPLSTKQMQERRSTAAIMLPILLVGLLYPFRPFQWIVRSRNEGTVLFDRMTAIPLVVGALFFNYRLACQQLPLRVTVGRWSFDYRRTWFWPMILSEILIVAAVLYTGDERWRAVGALCVVSVLWVLGWAKDSESIKREMGWQTRDFRFAKGEGYCHGGGGCGSQIK